MFEILVVEDQGWVRSVLATMLQDAGFSVRQAGGVAEALQHAKGLPEGGILVIDIGLGEAIDGFEVARLVQAARPEGMPTLYVTGDPDYFEGKTLNADERRLVKPFTETALITAIGELMPHAYRHAAHNGDLVLDV